MNNNINFPNNVHQRESIFSLLRKEVNHILLALTNKVNQISLAIINGLVKIKTQLSSLFFSNKWKSYPKIDGRIDFSFAKPKVDMSGLDHLPKNLNKQLQKKCLNKMNEAMKSLDSSMAFALHQMIQSGELAKTLDVMDRFNNRILELYEAYKEIQKKNPKLPDPDKLVHLKSEARESSDKGRNYRKKLFNIYMSKNLVNEILKSPVLTEKINAFLKKQGKNWQIDTQLADFLRKDSPENPLFMKRTYVHEIMQQQFRSDNNILTCDSPYLGMASVVGIKTQEELAHLRTIYMAWINHSENDLDDKIKTAIKSFGIRYKQAPDNYNRLGPSSPRFRNLVKEQQRAGGYELPDYYLSSDYADQVLNEILETQKATELEQDKKVQVLRQNNHLLFQGFNNNYSLTDPFGITKWSVRDDIGKMGLLYNKTDCIHQGIVGVFICSEQIAGERKKLKKDDYELYMLLMGIGKKIETEKKFNVDVPLYDRAQNKELKLLTREHQIDELKKTLANRHRELDGVVEMIQHHSKLKAPPEQIKKCVADKLQTYLNEYGYPREISGFGENERGRVNIWTNNLLNIAGIHIAKQINKLTRGRFASSIDHTIENAKGNTAIPSTAKLGYEYLPHTPKGKWTDASSVSLLPDSPTATDWKKKMIQEAEQEILISGSYCGGKIFDEFLDEIKKALKKKPELRVKILSSTRFLTDENGCQNWTKIKELTAAYPDRFRLVLNHELMQVNGANETKFISNHAKMMIVDGKYMIFGGSGIVDRWALFNGTQTPSQEEQSQDPLLGIKDMIAKAFRDQDTFLTDSNPDGILETARLEFFKLMSIWYKYNQNHPEIHPLQAEIKDTKTHSDDFYQKIDREKPIARLTEIPGSKLGFPVCKDVKVKLFANGPENSENTFSREIVNLINHANTNIEINHMYIHFTADVLNALKRALDRGVKVKVITNGDGKDSPGGHGFFGNRNMQMIRELHGPKGRKNLEVYLWDIPKTTNHKKALVVDDVVVAGSSNFGYKGLKSMSDYEMNMMIKSKEYAKCQRELNKKDIKYCKPVSIEEATSFPSPIEILGSGVHKIIQARIG